MIANSSHRGCAGGTQRAESSDRCGTLPGMAEAVTTYRPASRAEIAPAVVTQ